MDTFLLYIKYFKTKHAFEDIKEIFTIYILIKSIENRCAFLLSFCTGISYEFV